MAIKLVMPSLTLSVGEGGSYRWKDKKRFVEELMSLGLRDSQVDKVWRMYADRAFILQFVSKGFGYIIDRRHMATMAGALGIHGTVRGCTGAHRLAKLVERVGCFMMWYDDRNELVQFASPLFQEGGII